MPDDRLAPLQTALAELNASQRSAVEHGASGSSSPLLVIAGAGSGKTKTLAHRVAQLIVGGIDPARILLLTFSRRAAQDMTRRAQALVNAGRRGGTQLLWSGTFHSIASRLLRLHAADVGLSSDFTVVDRSDSADLIDVLRQQLGFAKAKRRFPQKATCLSIYSSVINTQRPLENCLRETFPWCADWLDELRALFQGYVDAKQERHVLDYDDLLLFWFHLVSEPGLAARVSARFDHILVDEYQDTNALQASILRGLRPSGKGMMVVGDDAQSIYSFRGATVRNILDFPSQFQPAAAVVTLAQNYRSTQPILDAANAVISLSAERFTKDLFSTRRSAQLPRLVCVEDEQLQADYVVERVLERRESGVALKKQAVLMRASHHSDVLEVELARRNIPFKKYGGLKFLESAHVKDLLCVLRWAENPRDTLAAFRVLQLLPGIGPTLAERIGQHVAANGFDLSSLADVLPPPSAREEWPAFSALMPSLRGEPSSWPAQVGGVRRWYQPHLERIYDGVTARGGDLDQLEQIAGSYPSRERFLSELTLDPPEAAGGEAVPPSLDEDYLILTTIHSAKGQEWDSVFVLHAVDGCIPSDMAADSPEQLEEERRLLYVAMTRARDELHLITPLKFFVTQQRRFGDRHLYAHRTRFIPDDLLPLFECASHPEPDAASRETLPVAPTAIDVAARLRAMWSTPSEKLPPGATVRTLKP